MEKIERIKMVRCHFCRKIETFDENKEYSEYYPFPVKNQKKLDC